MRSVCHQTQILPTWSNNDFDDHDNDSYNDDFYSAEVKERGTALPT